MTLVILAFSVSRDFNSWDTASASPYVSVYIFCICSVRRSSSSSMDGVRLSYSGDLRAHPSRDLSPLALGLIKSPKSPIFFMFWERTTFRDSNGVVEPFKINEMHHFKLLKKLFTISVINFFSTSIIPGEWVNPEGEISMDLMVTIVERVTGAVIRGAERWSTEKEFPQI